MIESLSTESLTTYALELTAAMRALEQTLRHVKSELRTRLCERGPEHRTAQTRQGSVSVVAQRRRTVRPEAVRALFDAKELSVDDLFSLATFTTQRVCKTLDIAKADSVLQERRRLEMRVRPELETYTRGVEIAASLFESELATLVRHVNSSIVGEVVANLDEEPFVLRQAG